MMPIRAVAIFIIGLRVAVAAAESSSPFVGRWVGTMEGEHITISSTRILVVKDVSRDGTADVLWGGENPPNKVPAQVATDNITVMAPRGVARLKLQGDQLIGTFTVTLQTTSQRSQVGQVYQVTLSRTK